MSLHAQPSPETLDRLRRQRRNATLSSLFIAILGMALIVVILLIITMKLSKPEVPTIVSYTAVSEPDVKQEKPKVEVNRQNKPPSASMSAARVLVAATASPVAVPVADVQVDSQAVEFGMDEGFGQGWGEGEGFEQGSGMTLFGRKLEVKSIGVVLDVSGSMTRHLGRVLDEIDRVAPGSPVVLHVGCAIKEETRRGKLYEQDAPRDQFKKLWYLAQHKDYHQFYGKPDTEVDLTRPMPGPEVYEKLAGRSQTYFYAYEGSQACGEALTARPLRDVEAVYWFADFQDKHDLDEVKSVLRKMRGRKQKLYVHASGDGPQLPVIMQEIVEPTGGERILEEKAPAKK
ncbi:MAG: hypothetical protein ACQKBY_01640 [Verrucomicrobiales bacterium]